MLKLLRRLLGQTDTGPAARVATETGPDSAGDTGGASGHSAGGTAEVFRFRENLTVGPAGKIGKHSPPTGAAVVEVYDGVGNCMAMDVFAVSKVAPSGPWHLDGVPATYVRDGKTGRAHQEIAFPLAGSHPVDLPQHLKDKVHIGGTMVKLWWSAER